MLEEHAQVETVRQNRALFVRKVRLGNTSPLASSQLQLVCVHGTCASEQQYQSLLEKVHTLVTESDNGLSIQCLLFDLLGCGQSPPIRDRDAYSNAEMIADIQALTDRHVDPSVPVVMMGHSYACNLILPMLQARPVANLAGCIFLASAVECPENPNPGHVIMRLPIPILQCLQPTLTNAFIEKGVHPDHVELRQAVRDASNENDMFVAKAFYHHHKWFQLDQNPEIKLKSLVLHGIDDGILPVAAGQYLANKLQTELVLVERSSHLVQLEQPSVVAGHVWEFLRPLAQKK